MGKGSLEPLQFPAARPSPGLHPALLGAWKSSDKLRWLPGVVLLSLVHLAAVLHSPGIRSGASLPGEVSLGMGAAQQSRAVPPTRCHSLENAGRGIHGEQQSCRASPAFQDKSTLMGEKENQGGLHLHTGSHRQVAPAGSDTSRAHPSSPRCALSSQEGQGDGELIPAFSRCRGIPAGNQLGCTFGRETGEQCQADTRQGFGQAEMLKLFGADCSRLPSQPCRGSRSFQRAIPLAPEIDGTGMNHPGVSRSGCSLRGSNI